MRNTQSIKDDYKNGRLVLFCENPPDQASGVFLGTETDPRTYRLGLISDLPNPSPPLVLFDPSELGQALGLNLYSGADRSAVSFELNKTLEGEPNVSHEDWQVAEQLPSDAHAALTCKHPLLWYQSEGLEKQFVYLTPEVTDDNQQTCLLGVLRGIGYDKTVMKTFAPTELGRSLGLTGACSVDGNDVIGNMHRELQAARNLYQNRQAQARGEVLAP